jgi:chromosome partitioning protein
MLSYKLFNNFVVFFTFLLNGGRMNKETLRFSQISALTGIKRHTINARAKTLFKNSDLNRNSGNQILLSPHQIRQLISDRLNNIKGKIIYTGNLKGGVGKTTLAYLLINAISSLGLKTCAIDLDVQANLTKQYLNIDVEQPVFYDLIDNKEKIEDIIISLSPTLDFIPSSLKNSLIQKSLSMQPLKNHLTWFKSLCINYLKENYDVIIIDTPPHLTTLNSVFCLCLDNNDNIIIPACAEDFSIMGIQMFLEDILSIRESYLTDTNPKVSIIINRFFQNQKTNLEMLLKIGQKYGKLLSEIIIKDSAKIRETVNNKTPLGEIKHGKEIYETILNILTEINILKANVNEV